MKGDYWELFDYGQQMPHENDLWKGLSGFCDAVMPVENVAGVAEVPDFAVGTAVPVEEQNGDLSCSAVEVVLVLWEDDRHPGGAH
jgi:hypothetical protein